VKLLQAAGVDFALLGNEEKCCGDAARRMGNEMVYFMLASENIATMQAYGVKKIIVQCPHCFQALTRDYPQLGGNFEVIHHTELLEHLVQEGALKVPAALHEKICYHDSCYLGRYQDVYDPPRSLIKHTGAHLVEMPCHGAQSFCCGAGGGRMWLEENTGTRINNERASQALATEADALATACPFCLTMLSDGMLSLEGNQPVLDIAEILAEAINHEPAA
jgi:Fe-S oxidoreductase